MEFFDTEQFTFLVTTFKYSYISIYKIEKKRALVIYHKAKLTNCTLFLT